MKKPQALIGLLAALGTALGVLVAVIGLPYGRANYNAFAELYHNGTPSAGAVDFAFDCDASTVATDEVCNIPVSNTADIRVLQTFGNNSASVPKIGSFNYDWTGADPTLVNPNTPVPNIPALFPAAFDGFLTGATWQCLPAPNADIDPGPAIESRISCFNSGQDGPLFPNDGVHRVFSHIDYDDLAVAPGTMTLVVNETAVSDEFQAELGSCNPLIAIDMACGTTTLNFVIPPTDTPTNTPAPTDTPTPTNTFTPTATFTDTPTSTPTPLGASVVKVPESCDGDPNTDDLPNCDDSNPQEPLANLWICEVGSCAGPGEGNLIVFENVSNVQTGDTDGDTTPDGVGAYEFDVEYNNLAIASLNPCDVVFGLNGTLQDGAGATRGPVDELNSSNNPYCADDAGGAGNGSCSFSVITENVVHFGCATGGQTEGPVGDFTLAALNLIPHEDAADDLFPGNDNGIVTIIKDNGCEVVDIFGHPVAGSINGGLTPVCGDAVITIRILEGDLDLDCDVDVSDQQKIAFRYGSFFGSTLYGTWYDLEPNLHDLDIDIKDLQKVFGRDGSNCQDPVPAQTPVAWN
ncbi:MAG TPA: hypothetical protein VNM91_04640 [Dehalococcoidia bacterium]|nr:hypothetical protein [Dehalococcoidia bacterium]